MSMEQCPVPEGGGDGGDAARGGGGGGDGGDGLPLKPSPGAVVRPSQTRRPTECDISRMPDSPPRRSPGHRRAHSDVIGGLPDDIIDDLAAPGDGPPSLSSDENEEELIFSMFLNVDDKLTKNSAPDGAASSESGSSSCAVTTGGGGEAVPGAAGVEPHSHSMDASSSVSAEHLFGTPAMEGTSSSSQQAKKAISAAKLAELALIDPKKAKRIINNRQSAARSKERKMRYISELERKVQFMQREATALATQLALLQRDSAGLSAENSELKIRLQNTEHQVRLQDALNDALKSELQRLKAATGQVGTGGGGGGMMMMTMNFGGGPPPFVVGANRPPPTMFHANHQQAMPPPFQLAMQQHQQQLGPNPPHPPPLLHPLLQAQQLQQQAAALGALNNMRGPPPAAAAPLAPAPPGALSWGEAWSESSSG